MITDEEILEYGFKPRATKGCFYKGIEKRGYLMLNKVRTPRKSKIELNLNDHYVLFLGTINNPDDLKLIISMIL
jgi:hypothetical protein